MKFAHILTSTVLAALPALAQNSLTWVSHSGSDLSPCTAISPCRTFQGAFNQTNSGGIIRALDAGDYGPINISKPITIDGNGVGASIDVTGGGALTSGVLVNGTPGGVAIRSLAIHVAPNCICDGIDALNTSVNIQDVSITGVPVYGVHISSGTAIIRGVTVTGAQYGIQVQDGAANINDSVVQCSGIGVRVQGSAAATKVRIEHSQMIANTTGLQVDNSGAAATAQISDNIIAANATGTATTSGGQIITFRNNTWAANTNDGTTPFSASLK